MRPLPRWLRKLRPTGRRLLSSAQSGPGEAVTYLILPHGDRRRRALAEISAKAFRQARAEGLLDADGSGWALSPAGRHALEQGTAGCVDPGLARRALAETQILDDAGRLQTHTINLAESPLLKFAAQLAPPEIEAGERYRRDYLQSTLSQIATSDWLRPPGQVSASMPAGPDGAASGRLHARRRILETREKLGVQASRLMDAVLIEEESFAALERRFGWSARSGRSVVRFTLARLAEIYGLDRR